MTLLDPPAGKPDKSRAMAFTVAALVIIGAALLWFTLRFYPEKEVAEHFFDALVAGDMTHAYQIWEANPNYKMEDFLADWGPTGYFGPVKSYKIMRINSPRRTSSVVVEVAISPYAPLPSANDAEKSRKTRIVTLWIQPSDKSFSFPP
jgi:hypothetical protein